MPSLTDLLPPTIVETEQETLTLYRLGVFDKRMYELVELNEGQHYPAHVHHHSTAHLLVVRGQGIVYLDGRPELYAPGNTFTIKKGVAHGFSPHAPTLLLSIQSPPIINQKTGKVDITYSKDILIV